MQNLKYTVKSKMMKKYIIIAFYLLIPYMAVAQQYSISDSAELKNYAFQSLTGEKYDDPGYKHLNIYYKDYWLPGSIVLSDEQKIHGISLKYNGSNNQLVMLSTKFGQIKIDNHLISEFFLFDKPQTYHFKKINLDTLNLQNGIFCELAYNKIIKAFVYRRIKSDAINYRDDGMYRIYSPNPLYILYINNRIILLNKPNIAELFEQFVDLKAILKEKGRSFLKKTKNETDFFHFISENEDILIDLIK
jgi:hypothetical protein